MVWLKSIVGVWWIDLIFLSPESGVEEMYTYTTWKRDRLSPFIDYYFCGFVMAMGAFYGTSQWDLFIYSLFAFAAVGLVGYVALCYKWMTVYKWGIEYHSGMYRCTLDFGTFEVYRYTTKFGYLYEICDTAGRRLYARFWAPSEFAGIKAFERACKRNRVRMWFIERR